MFHPDHRIYLPYSEGQPVRGDGVCLEKGRGPECVCVCLSVCFVWVHVCLRGGRLDWAGTDDCVTLGSLQIEKCMS